MELAYTKPVRPAKATTKGIRETPFVLPEDVAEPQEWVVGLSATCPIEYVSIGGMFIGKQVISPLASLAENSGKQYFPRSVVRLFTEKQAKALREYAAGHTVYLPRRRNPEYEKNPQAQVFLGESTMLLGDFLVLEPTLKKEARIGSNRTGNSSNK